MATTISENRELADYASPTNSSSQLYQALRALSALFTIKRLEMDKIRIFTRLSVQMGLVLCLMLTISCSRGGATPEKTEDLDPTYEKGMSQLAEKNYDKGIATLRKVKADSAQYPQALQAIEKIPFQRAMDAFNQKDYKKTLIELQHIPSNNADSEQANRLKGKATFLLNQENFKNAKTTPQKIEFLQLLSGAAMLSNDADTILLILDWSGGLLRNNLTKDQANKVLDSMQALLRDQSKPEILYKGLEHVFAAYKIYYAHSETRSHMLQMIGAIKLKFKGEMAG